MLSKVLKFFSEWFSRTAVPKWIVLVVPTITLIMVFGIIYHLAIYCIQIWLSYDNLALFIPVWMSFVIIVCFFFWNTEHILFYLEAKFPSEFEGINLLARFWWISAVFCYKFERLKSKYFSKVLQSWKCTLKWVQDSNFWYLYTQPTMPWHIFSISLISLRNLSPLLYTPIR